MEEDDYERYIDSLDPSERESFRQLVKEEMERMEKDFQQQAVSDMNRPNNTNNTNLRTMDDKDRSYDSVLSSPQRRYVPRIDVTEGEPTYVGGVAMGIQKSPSDRKKDKQKYAMLLNEDLNTKKQQLSRQNSLGSSGLEIGGENNLRNRPDIRRSKQDDYRMKLEEQIEMNKASKHEPDRRTTLSDAYRSRVDDNRFSGGLMIGSDPKADKEKDRTRKQEYAQALQQQMHFQGLNGQGSGNFGYVDQDMASNGFSDLNNKSRSSRSLYQEESNESTERRSKQREYYNKLQQDSNVTPVASERLALFQQRNARVPSANMGNDNNSGTSLNIGGDDEMEKRNRRDKQRLYSQQLGAARDSAPITSERVPLYNKKRDQYDEEAYGSVASTSYSTSSASPSMTSVHNSGRLSKRSGNGDSDEYERRRMAQVEYARQLEEDSRVKSVVKSKDSSDNQRAAARGDSMGGSEMYQNYGEDNDWNNQGQYSSESQNYYGRRDSSNKSVYVDEDAGDYDHHGNNNSYRTSRAGANSNNINNSSSLQSNGGNYNNVSVSSNNNRAIFEREDRAMGNMESNRQGSFKLSMAGNEAIGSGRRSSRGDPYEKNGNNNHNNSNSYYSGSNSNGNNINNAEPRRMKPQDSSSNSSSHNNIFGGGGSDARSARSSSRGHSYGGGASSIVFG